MDTTNTDSGFKIAGIGLGGLLVIAGVLIAVFGPTFLGLVVALIGLIAFGGFSKGRWY